MIRGRTTAGGAVEFVDTATDAAVFTISTDGATGGTVAAADITDATAVGRSVLTAEDAAAAGLLTGTASAIDDATTFADLPAAVTAYNALLAVLRTRGVLAEGA